MNQFFSTSLRFTMKAIFALFLVLAFVAMAMAATHHHHHSDGDDSGTIIDRGLEAGKEAAGDIGDAVKDFFG